MNSRGCFNNHLLQYCYHITSRQVANTKRSHFRGYIVLTHGSIYILRFFGGQFSRGSKVGLFENGFIIIFPKWPYMGVLLCIPFSDIPKVLRIFWIIFWAAIHMGVKFTCPPLHFGTIHQSYTKDYMAWKYPYSPAINNTKHLAFNFFWWI